MFICYRASSDSSVISLTFSFVTKLYIYNFSGLQVVIASKAWTLLPSALRPDRNSLFSVLLNSRANSTAKKYINEIKKFYAYQEKLIKLKDNAFCLVYLSGK